MVKYKYCIQCATLLDQYDNFFQCPKCGAKFYRNSKPTAGILPVKDGKVLISKRGIEPYKGKYDVIGGFLNEDEHPEKGATREVKEETGLKVKILDLIGIYIDRYGKSGDYTQNTYYIGEITGGKLTTKDDVSSLHWVSITNPPDMAFKHQKQLMEDLKNWYKKTSRGEKSRTSAA